MLSALIEPFCIDVLIWSNSLMDKIANKIMSIARSTFKAMFYLNGGKEKKVLPPSYGECNQWE